MHPFMKSFVAMIVFELLEGNLYDLMVANNYNGLS